MSCVLRLLRFGIGAGGPAIFLLCIAARGGEVVSPDSDLVFLSRGGSWDRNHDGIITCDEWKAYAGELFDAADANHDGFVDRTEYATIVNTDRMFQTVDL